MEIIFHSQANKTHFHKKGCAPSLILKVRIFGARKWPIELWQPVCHTGKATGSAKVFLCTLFFRFVLFLFCFLHTLHVCWVKSPSKACVTTWQQKQKVKWLFFLILISVCVFFQTVWLYLMQTCQMQVNFPGAAFLEST